MVCLHIKDLKIILAKNVLKVVPWIFVFLKANSKHSQIQYRLTLGAEQGEQGIVQAATSLSPHLPA